MSDSVDQIKTLAFDLGTHCGVCVAGIGQQEDVYTIDLSKANEEFLLHPAAARYKIHVDMFVMLWRKKLLELFKSAPAVVAWEDVAFGGPGIYAVQKWAALKAILLMTLREACPKAMIAPIPVSALRSFIMRHLKGSARMAARSLKDASLLAARAACPDRFSKVKTTRAGHVSAIYDKAFNRWLDSNAIEAWFLYRLISQHEGR